MTATIPLIEPTRMRAGETWQWRREDLVPDYPASAGWTLKYALKNATQHLEFSATADGDMFAITVASSVTANVVAGKYRMIGYVEDTSTPPQRFGVCNEEILVDASYATALPVDDRTHARKALEAIEATIEGRATQAQLEYMIGHRQVRYMSHNDLIDARKYYRGEVRSEDLKDQAGRGQGGGRVVGRF